MEKSVPGEACHSVATIGGGLSPSDPVSHPGLNLLLVSRDARWAQAVQSATREIGGGGVSTCLARDALARLARHLPHYSHLLVDGDDADGLLDALADLTIEIASPDTAMLMLGTAVASHPAARVIAAADISTVRDALLTPATRTLPATEMALTDLLAALDGAMIEPRYQPIIRMADRRPIGLEALARLNHPVAGLLLPARFVPQLEDAGFAGQLTDLISACMFNDLSSPALAGGNLRMSVNFPLDVMLRPNALDRLEAQRARAGVPASRIVVELTESRPVEDVVALRRPLERLRALGYGIAIDDVGPAVPRLAPLLDLPFTSLKLDKDLVMHMAGAPETRDFLARTIVQAKRHGLTVVAEGVETEEIWAQMAAMGADEAQGFLAARPLPLAAVPIWLEAWAGSAGQG